MKYEVSISDGFGEPEVVIVHTALGDFSRAIKLALDSHYDSEDEVIEIKCRKIKENKNGWKEINNV